MVDRAILLKKMVTAVEQLHNSIIVIDYTSNKICLFSIYKATIKTHCPFCIYHNIGSKLLLKQMDSPILSLHILNFFLFNSWHLLI